MINSALNDKYINDNLASLTIPIKVPKTNTIKYFSDDQLVKIWKRLNPYWIPIMKYLVYTGIRKSDLINLTWENVSLDDNNPTITLTSTDEASTKSGRTHVIRITKTALDILKKQVGKHAIFVFVSEKSKKIRSATPNEKLNKALDGTGIKGTIHRFGHTFGADFVMKITSIYELTQYLFHSDIEITKIYAHFSPDYMKVTAELIISISKSQRIFTVFWCQAFFYLQVPLSNDKNIPVNII